MPTPETNQEQLLRQINRRLVECQHDMDLIRVRTGCLFQMLVAWIVLTIIGATVGAIMLASQEPPPTLF